MDLSYPVTQLLKEVGDHSYMLIPLSHVNIMQRAFIKLQLNMFYLISIEEYATSNINCGNHGGNVVCNKCQ